MVKQSRVFILCGKGGVGKTTLALSLGLREATRGRKVLIVTSHPLPELAVSVSLEGLGARTPVAAKNLFVVHLDAKVLLAEEVEKSFPVPMLARAVLNSSIYRNLVEVAPGLKEFYFLARLQQLAERKRAQQEAPDFELLLWDAPAMGHFLSTLRAARGFEVYLNGPLAAAGADLRRFFSSKQNVGILPVAMLEEMAIEETVEMCAALRKEFELPPLMALMNQVSPLVSRSDADAEQARNIATTDEVLRFTVQRGLADRERAAELRTRLDAPTLAVPRVWGYKTDLELLERLGVALAPLEV